jgi:hypothetical protein
VVSVRRKPRGLAVKVGCGSPAAEVEREKFYILPLIWIVINNRDPNIYSNFPDSERD